MSHWRSWYSWDKIYSIKIENGNYVVEVAKVVEIRHSVSSFHVVEVVYITNVR